MFVAALLTAAHVVGSCDQMIGQHQNLVDKFTQSQGGRGAGADWVKGGKGASLSSRARYCMLVFYNTHLALSNLHISLSSAAVVYSVVDASNLLDEDSNSFGAKVSIHEYRELHFGRRTLRVGSEQRCRMNLAELVRG